MAWREYERWTKGRRTGCIGRWPVGVVKGLNKGQVGQRSDSWLGRVEVINDVTRTVSGEQRRWKPLEEQLKQDDGRQRGELLRSCAVKGSRRESWTKGRRFFRREMLEQVCILMDWM